MAETLNGPIAGYDLSAPDKDYAIKSLSRFIDEKEASDLWSTVCEERKIAEDTQNLEELAEVFKAISNESGTKGVVGNSLVVRLMSYKMLKRKNG